MDSSYCAAGYYIADAASVVNKTYKFWCSKFNDSSFCDASHKIANATFL